MESLEVLGLNDTQVTDEGMNQLASLKRLKEVHLVRTRIGNGTLKTLAEMPNLHTLRIRDTQISDEGLVSLTKCKNLKKLDLSENNSPGITDEGLESIAKITSLTDLNLWTTQVSGRRCQSDIGPSQADDVESGQDKDYRRSLPVAFPTCGSLHGFT